METVVMIVVDIVIFAVGIYLLVSALRMKHTGKIDSLILAQEELKKCKKPQEFIAFIAWKEAVFGGILALVGLLGALGEEIAFPGAVKYVLLGVFLVVFGWFYLNLKRAKEQFLSI